MVKALPNTTWLTVLSWTILALAGLVLVGGLSAHALWPNTRVRARVIRPVSMASHARLGLSPLDQGGVAMPGEIAAPAKGVTGTMALPDLPIPPDALTTGTTDVGVVPAAPFSMKGAAAIDRARAMECLTAAIYYEAASEPDTGQSAVAQVILNRVRHPAFPATVCGVVYQGSEHAGCQFSFACDGAVTRVPMRSAWIRASRAAGMALAGYVYAPVGLATHYHTYAVTPAWNRSLVMTDVVGAHFFHRWKGYWGTAAAFSQVYRSGEPVPGPHPRLAPPIAPVDPALGPAATVAMPPAPATGAAQVKPAYADSGSYVASGKSTTPPNTSDGLPAASQVLDKWKDSGKPLSEVTRGYSYPGSSNQSANAAH